MQFYKYCRFRRKNLKINSQIKIEAVQHTCIYYDKFVLLFKDKRL